MRFYIDEDLPPIIAEVLRAYGINAISCRDTHWYGRPDREVLYDVAVDDRCVVTANRDDFLKLTTEFAVDGRPHAGVVIVPSSIPREQYNAIVEALIELHRQFPDGMHPYTPIYLKRVRRGP